MSIELEAMRVRAVAEVGKLRAEVERLKAELAIAQKFHNVAVKERNLARHEVEQLRAVVNTHKPLWDQLNAAEARAVKAEAERDKLLAGCANAGWYIESGNPIGFIRKLKRERDEARKWLRATT